MAEDPCLQQFGIRKCELFNDFGAGSLDTRGLAEEGNALVVVHLHDLIGIILGGDRLGGLRELQLLDAELL